MGSFDNQSHDTREGHRSHDVEGVPRWRSGLNGLCPPMVLDHIFGMSFPHWVPVRTVLGTMTEVNPFTYVANVTPCIKAHHSWVHQFRSFPLP